MDLNPQDQFGSSISAAQIVASMANPAAGPTYSVAQLSDALRGQGIESRILTVGKQEDASFVGAGIVQGRHDFSDTPLLRNLYFSGALNREIAAAALRGSVLHAHGLWLMPNIYPARHSKRARVPLLHAPRGMLGKEALEFSAGRKALFGMLAQKHALRCVDCFHATSEQEMDDIRRYGLKGPVAIIPNGIELPDLDNSPIVDKARTRNERTVLYLGRVHPKKGLHRMLDAWAQIEADFPGWRLRIVGPSEGGFGTELRSQAEALQLRNVRFEPGLFGREKTVAYQQADLFVLPTLNENFGMVVAESLANATPVICTKGAPWSGLNDRRCGWWIDHGVDPLATALRSGMSISDGDRGRMGARGRAWMQEAFLWEGVAQKMAAVYRWLKLGGAVPPTVYLGDSA